MNEPGLVPQPLPPPAVSCLRSVEEALSECQRELQVRTRCYPRWVTEGKLTSVDARDRMDRLGAAVEYLQRAFDLQAATET